MVGAARELLGITGRQWDGGAVVEEYPSERGKNTVEVSLAHGWQEASYEDFEQKM